MQLHYIIYQVLQLHPAIPTPAYYCSDTCILLFPTPAFCWSDTYILLFRPDLANLNLITPNFDQPDQV